jgi:hypothetical protein
MMRTLDEVRISDETLKENKKISIFIENQFPAIYREHGRELVELVKAYYRFLEENESQSIYNIRKIYEYRNIDTTLDRMILFFKNKFLNGLFFNEDVRFIVKHILDFYRRKGSNESIQLFFRLFFESEVEIYFPSQDIFKPSTSVWKTGSYIQLYSTIDITPFSGIVNRKIFGDKSNAEAFIDSVYFVKVKGAYVPVIFISDVKGRFIGFDTIYSLDPDISYGRIYGSLETIDVDQGGEGSGGNSIGQLVDLKSSSGFGAKGRITKVTENLSGEINFSVEDGSYGYTTSNTDILVSDQNAFFSETVGDQFRINEQIKQSKVNTPIDVFGTVIGKTSDSIGIFLDYSQMDEQSLSLNTTGEDFVIGEEISQTNSFNITVFGTVSSIDSNVIVVNLNKNKPEVLLDVETQRYFFEKNNIISTTERQENISKEVINVEDDYFFENQIEIETVSREENISDLPLFITEKNTTARVSINTIKDTETITIITDIISDYLNVSINSNNYSEIPPAIIEMSGTRVNGITPNLETQISDAFVPETFELGTIESLKDINPGINHLSEVFVLARENILSRFNLQNQILNVSTPEGVLLTEGNQISQTKQVKTFEDELITVQVRGEIVSIQGNNITVKQKTFESFIINEPIFREGSNIPITVNFRSRDPNSIPLGLNAKIRGDIELVAGKIQEVQVIDSGIGYEDGSIVEIFNIDLENTQPDIVGVARARGQGITEGRWRSFESHTNQEKKIQDSFFYQDYSYEITTEVEPSIYKDEYKNLVHPSGIKLFTKFGQNSVINTNVDTNPISLGFSEFQISEPLDISLSLQNGFNYINEDVILIGEISEFLSVDSTTVGADNNFVTVDLGISLQENLI